MGGMIAWLMLTITLGATFIGGQGIEYAEMLGHGMRIDTNLFTTTFFTLTGFHGIHVIVGLLLLLIVLGLALAGDFSTGSPPAVLGMAGIYWHFVDVVWILVLTVVYIIPHFRMNTTQFLTEAWVWSPLGVVCAAAGCLLTFAGLDGAGVAGGWWRRRRFSCWL
jgi:hypothetical protein